MYQVIPNNVSENLLKRVLILIIIMITSMVIIYLYQNKQSVSNPSVDSSVGIPDVSRAAIVFSSIGI